MSFLSSAFSGASNNFVPQGNKEALTNYQQAGTGLNTLANSLQQQMNGGGPNLANQQLQNATGQNVANQAALQGGQRGASSNVGLMSRQIAQQGGQLQQQAAGQSAQNVLAQQLAAQQQLGGVLGTQGQLGANVLTNNNTIGSNQGKQNAQMNQGIVGGIANAGMSLLALADGGAVLDTEDSKGFGKDSSFNNSNFGNNFVSGKKPGTPQNPTPYAGKDPTSGITSGIQTDSGVIPMLVAARGGAINQLPFAPITDYRRGGEVKAQNPKQKATVPGNSYANDKIPAMVSEDEVVLPRDITQSPDAPAKAAQFMAQVMAGKHRVKR